MKKALPLLSLTLLILVSASCATAAPLSGRTDSADDPSGNDVSVISRPDDPARRQSSGDRWQLPQPGASRQETEAAVRRQALRFIASLKVWLKSGALVRLNQKPVERTTPVPVAPAPAPRTPDNTQPQVKPVVSTTEADRSRNASDPSGGSRTVFARLGDEVEISFKESGWLLLEKPPEGAGLEYVNRDLGNGKTLFKFRGAKIGNYLLPFQFQDQSKGVITRQLIEIKVVSQKDFDAAVGGKETESDRENKTKRRAYAAKLLELGNFKEALREYLASYGEGDPVLNQIIAALALREKDYQNAALYWKKNLEGAGELHDKAVLGLIRVALALQDRIALLALARQLIAIQGQPIEPELGLLIRYFSNLKDEALEFDLLSEYIKRFPEGLQLAEVYFLLGQIYEFSRPLLDFKKSRECYQVVVRAFPESQYYAPAKERIDFINRHYFRVQ
jgi:tetratricopeptide (TPR) repeat protein